MMQVVVNIDDNLYTRLFDNGNVDAVDVLKICAAVRKGKPLPEKYGNLIDANKLAKEVRSHIHDTSNLHYDDLEEAEAYNAAYCNCLDEIEDADTIIEANEGTGGVTIGKQALQELMIKCGFHAPDMTVTEFVEDLSLLLPEVIKCEDCIHNGSFDTDCPIRWPGKEYCSFAEGKEDLDCSSCEYQNEVDGSNCYECVKGIHNNYKAESENEE